MRALSFYMGCAIRESAFRSVDAASGPLSTHFTSQLTIQQQPELSCISLVSLRPLFWHSLE